MYSLRAGMDPAGSGWGGCTSPGWVLISAISIWDWVSIMGPGITVHVTSPAIYSGQQRKWCNYVDDMLLCSF